MVKCYRVILLLVLLGVMISLIFIVNDRYLLSKGDMLYRYLFSYTNWRFWGSNYAFYAAKIVRSRLATCREDWKLIREITGSDPGVDWPGVTSSVKPLWPIGRPSRPNRGGLRDRSSSIAQWCAINAFQWESLSSIYSESFHPRPVYEFLYTCWPNLW